MEWSHPDNGDKWKMVLNARHVTNVAEAGCKGSPDHCRRSKSNLAGEACASSALLKLWACWSWTYFLLVSDPCIHTRSFSEVWKRRSSPSVRVPPVDTAAKCQICQRLPLTQCDKRGLGLLMWFNVCQRPGKTRHMRGPILKLKIFSLVGCILETDFVKVLKLSCSFSLPSTY